mgnify:FL=1
MMVLQESIEAWKMLTNRTIDFGEKDCFLPLTGLPVSLSTRRTDIGWNDGTMTDVNPTQPTVLSELIALALPSVAP